MMTQPTQQTQPVPPTQPFQVTLEAQQWNGVMAALSEAPFRVAAPLIQAISEQLNGQAAPLANGQDGMVMPPRDVPH